MIYESDIPDDDLISLADDLDIKSEELRDAFKKAMNHAASVYGFLEANPHNAVKEKEQNKDLQKTSQKLIKAIDAFEKVLVNYPGEPCTDKNKLFSLTRINLEAPRGIQSSRKKVKANAEAWKMHASIICDNHKKLKTGGGDNLFNDLLIMLIDAYEAGGKKVGISRSDVKEDKYYGPMFVFINDCFDLLGANRKPNSAMGRAIENAIRKRKNR